ncbi:NAD-dependent epimerase/dehydratase family protein [Paenibacillus sp. NPDC056722]|uniref:NAD-dependent epimerase/dehydratase family protein n=1 Tax=Paenibacillus sp. NPDC056722 TaxID=3345924 RepID=UPI003684462D
MNANQLHVVVGSGPLGVAVMNELLKRGIRTKVVNLNSIVDVPPEVELTHANVGDAEQASEVFKGAAVVYHCAKPNYTKWPEEFPRLTKGIMEGAMKAEAKLVYADNLYMYGPSKEAYHEKMPNQAVERKGLTRAQMADEILKAYRSGKLRAVIGRGSDFYGPGVLHSILGGDMVFKKALQGKPAQVIGNIDVPHTHIYIQDFAAGLVNLALADDALGQIWHLASAETTTTRNLISQVYSQLQIPSKVRAAPSLVFQLMSLFNPFMREMKEVEYIYTTPYVVNHSKYVQKFGDHTTPHAQAISETIDWFRSSKH